tara:strand:+ start:84 stop:1085 length:1002 start_codon:yes stop_codon:yes gene_type:complete
MESVLQTNKVNPALLFSAALVVGYFFVGVSFVRAQVVCGEPPPGALIVTHQVCAAVPQSNGSPCQVIGAPGIAGMCMNGCCQVVAYTPPPSIFGGALGGGFIEGVAQGVVVQTAVGFINNLISGGLGTGAYSGSSGTQYDYIDGATTFLDTIDDYGTNNNDTGFNLDFGDDNSDNANTTGSPFTILDRDNPNTNVTGGASSVPNNNENTQEPEGDSVTTSYQSLDGGVNNSDRRTTEFGQEFLDNLDDPAYSSGLSLAELERAAEEARRREALLNEQNAVSGNIGDYRSSNVSQSGLNGDSLADGYYDSLGTDEERLAWWRRILILIGEALGF